MEELKYIHQCVTQALALEEAGIASKSMRLANLRYIKTHLDKLVSEASRAEAEQKAATIVRAIRDRI